MTHEDQRCHRCLDDALKIAMGLGTDRLVHASGVNLLIERMESHVTSLKDHEVRELQTLDSYTGRQRKQPGPSTCIYLFILKHFFNIIMCMYTCGHVLILILVVFIALLLLFSDFFQYTGCFVY